MNFFSWKAGGLQIYCKVHLQYESSARACAPRRIRAFQIFAQHKTTPKFTTATRSHLKRACGIVIVESVGERK